MTFLLTFGLGVVMGVVGNFATAWLRALVARADGRIEIKGFWAESMAEGAERSFSIGQIRYDFLRRTWVFDGTNFHNDGTAFCHWQTITSYLDRKDHRFYYTFLNTHVDSAHTGYTGFGVVYLERRGKAWVPRNGAFVAGNPGEAFRSHSMLRLEEMPRSTDDVRAVFAKLAPGASGA